MSIENSLSMDTDDIKLDIDDHIEDKIFIDDFDCPNTLLSEREKFNTPLAIAKILEIFCVIVEPKPSINM